MLRVGTIVQADGTTAVAVTADEENEPARAAILADYADVDALIAALGAGAITFGAFGASANAEVRRTPARADAIRHQIDELQRDVNRNDNRDQISEREAAGLRGDVARLQNEFRDYNRDGLSNVEMRSLNNRIQTIRGRLHGERRDHDHHRM